MAEARAIYADDPERSLEIRRRVAASEVSPAWSNAHVDLASHEAGQANYQSAADHCEVVLRASVDQVDPAARAVAGVILCDAREVLRLPVDEHVLANSAEAAAAVGHPYYAGAGLSQLSRLELSRGERDKAIATLKRAIAFYEQSESWYAAPGALLRLATIEVEGGDDKDEARHHIERAVSALDKLPYPGTSGTRLRQKLLMLRESLGKGS